MASLHGPSKSAAEEPVPLLLECHERIRRFGAMAIALGDAAAPSSADVLDGATRVHRYFAIALPLHVLDEERSIAPRLLGKGLDDALSVMAREHSEHAPLLATLLDECVHLTLDATRDRSRLLRLARELAPLFESHLAAEEQRVFPVIANLPSAERVSLLGEMRARRT